MQLLSAFSHHVIYGVPTEINLTEIPSPTVQKGEPRAKAGVFDGKTNL